ncbi:MAG: serine/threonine protein kinase, partial [Candidatus Coatesbacteria bacterium]|nr:serine/threonine protein kinase [Candidatus Coatesbacteria bacterium]
QMIRRDGPFEVDLAYTVISQVCLGLDAAHRVGVIHRDVKPQNILITENYGVKIVDLGLARHLGGSSVSQTGIIMGTPDYMSPEQARGKSLDARSDIYSLGVVMYEMFTGKLPFTGESSVAILLAHMRQPPESPMRVRPDLPPWVSYMILKAMAKKPSGRYTKTTELLGYFEKSMAESKMAEADEKPELAEKPEKQEAQEPEVKVPHEYCPSAGGQTHSRRKLRLLSMALVAFIAILTIIAIVVVRTQLESPAQIQAIISDAKEFERQQDFEKAFEVYIKGIKELPVSISLYFRAGLAYVQYLSHEHPVPLVISLIVILISLIAPLFLIQQRLRR